jgi:hypothetical protein
MRLKLGSSQALPERSTRYSVAVDWPSPLPGRFAAHIGEQLALASARVAPLQDAGAAVSLTT